MRVFLYCFVFGSDLFYVGFSLLAYDVRFKGILLYFSKTQLCMDVWAVTRHDIARYHNERAEFTLCLFPTKPKSSQDLTQYGC